jgi:hypothetical protein
MLYDKRWEKPEVKTSGHMYRLVSWLEKQPANKAYDYTNPINCGYAQYLRSYGIFAAVSPWVWVGFWLGIIPVAWRIPPGVDDLLNDGNILETFGAALERARKVVGPQDTGSDNG